MYEDIKVLENIKEYMQSSIDKGYHKFIYNDLGYAEKCIDVINAIDNLINRNKSLEQENNFLKLLYRNTDEFKNIENCKED